MTKMTMEFYFTHFYDNWRALVPNVCESLGLVLKFWAELQISPKASICCRLVSLVWTPLRCGTIHANMEFFPATLPRHLVHVT
ncbi:hypothetical protein LINPERHAP1_LOCUS34254 [Linum perenne]